MGRSGTGRSLKTARAVLRVLRFLAAHPTGVRTEDVARHLEKSSATASYLLNSLCQEGYASRDPHDGLYRLIDEDPEPEHPVTADRIDGDGTRLADAVDELYGRTAQRSYLATSDDHAIMVREARGRQGLPKIPGLGPRIRSEAHATAFGKVLLAYGPPDCLPDYIDAFGTRDFTPTTLTDPRSLDTELAKVRSDGYALDREEYAVGFCCVAAPVVDTTGALRGALALSVTAARFTAQSRALIAAVTDTAAAAGMQVLTSAADLAVHRHPSLPLAAAQ